MRIVEAIAAQQAGIIEAWLGAARGLPAAARVGDAALVDGMPGLLSHLVQWLATDAPEESAAFEEASRRHAIDRLRRGYTMPEIVAEYSAFRSTIHDHIAPLIAVESARSLRRLNGAIDRAIADAVACFVDDRRRFEAESAARLQSIIDNAPAAIYIKEYRRTGGTYTAVNRHFCERFRFETQQVLGHRDEHLFPHLDAAALADAIARDRRILETGEPIKLEHPFPVDGEMRTWLLIEFPLRDTDGVPYAVCGIATDITDEKNLEIARDRFIAILGHDLRNPLNTISLAGGYLLQRDDTDPVVRKQAAKIMRSTERMGEMISDVLDFARGRLGGGIPIDRRPCDLGTIARHVVDEIEATYPDRTIAVRVSGDVRGDWDDARVAQALSNLIGNALVHGEGTVTVAVAGAAEAVSLSVHNLGAPIPEHLRAKLFQPFGGSTGGGGLGLGLFIVCAIARAHRGSVQVRSDETGTTFTLVLPRAP